MIKQIISLILLAVSIPMSLSAQQTKILTAEKHNEYGLVYFLPTTVLNVEVTAEIRTMKRGPYYQYARKFLGTDDVIKNDASAARITSLKVVPTGVADTEASYLMQLKPGALTYLCVADDGMLLAINKRLDSSQTIRKDGADQNAQESARSGKEYLKYVNEDFIASQSSFKQAEMLAESLMEIRESKLELTRGTAETMPVDGRQMELMLKALDEQERSIAEAFTGVETKTVVSRTFSYTPDEEGRFTLLRMSDFAGFVDPDDLSGAPVYIEISDIIAPDIPVDAKGEEKKIPKDAVIYTLPGSAMVTITFDGQILFKDRIEMAQMGMNFGLAPALFTDKKQPSWATFNPVTGAVDGIGTLTGESE